MSRCCKQAAGATPAENCYAWDSTSDDDTAVDSYECCLAGEAVARPWRSARACIVLSCPAPFWPTGSRSWRARVQRWAHVHRTLAPAAAAPLAALPPCTLAWWSPARHHCGACDCAVPCALPPSTHFTLAAQWNPSTPECCVAADSPGKLLLRGRPGRTKGAPRPGLGAAAAAGLAACPRTTPACCSKAAVGLAASTPLCPRSHLQLVHHGNGRVEHPHQHHQVLHKG